MEEEQSVWKGMEQGREGKVELSRMTLLRMEQRAVAQGRDATAVEVAVGSLITHVNLTVLGPL